MNKSKLREQISGLQMAEATGYILRSDGSQIISSLATPADLVYHMGVKYKEEVENKLANQRKAILEEVRSEVIGEDTEIRGGSGAYFGLNEDQAKNKLRKEQRQKLSLLEGKK